MTGPLIGAYIGFLIALAWAYLVIGDDDHALIRLDPTEEVRPRRAAREKAGEVEITTPWEGIETCRF